MKDNTFTIRLVKILVVLLLAIIIISALRYNCEIVNITVNGSSIYTDKEIWDKTSANPLDIYAPFYVFTVNRGKYPAIPFIEQIDAKLTALNSVELTVYEKRMIGCLYAMGGYFYFDRDGLVVEYNPERLEGITLVKGADFDSVVLGKNLKVIDNSKYFDAVSNIVMSLESVELSCDLIAFMYDGSVVLSLGETDVRLGKHEDYKTAVTALPDILRTMENRNMTLYMENYSETNRTVQALPKE